MEGVNDGLLRGPLLGYPVIGVKVTRVKATINKNETSTAALKTASINLFINLCIFSNKINFNQTY